MHVLIFAGGTLRPGRAIDQAIASAELCLAADSGAQTALKMGCTPAIAVGDFDSLPPAIHQELIALGTEIISTSPEKNETDTELAIQTALERGATQITLLGGLGGERFDHTIANILLLAGFTEVPIRIIDGPSFCWLLQGPARTVISGQTGDLLSLLPLTGAATGLRTQGLYYPLYGETLYFGKPRGMSNLLTQPEAEVSFESGLLLVIHTATDEINH